MNKLFIYDLETTGVMYWKCGVWQLSAKIVINGETKEKINFKIRPHEKAIIEPEALKVGNVTEEQIKAYPHMNEVFPILESTLNKYVQKYNKKDKFYLVGYNNAPFDNNFFRAFFKQNAKTPKEAEMGNYFGSYFWSNSLDLMVLASRELEDVRPEMVDFKLKTVAKQLGIIVDETKLHDAEYDLEITHEVLKELDRRRNVRKQELTEQTTI